MENLRCILLVLDGLADKGHPVFEGKTPLQVARTPNLDHLARLGMNGLYHTCFQGAAMPSELAHFAMFGYDTVEFPGRGVIEAIGYDLPFGDEDVAILARILSAEAEGNVLVMKEENIDLDSKTFSDLHGRIAHYRKDGIEIEFVPTRGQEGILMLRGDVSPDITDSNPIYEGRPLMEVLPRKTAAESERATHTAGILNSYLVWCYETLSAHPANAARRKAGLMPANAVATQRAGRRRNITPFGEKWGLKALSVSSGAVYHGLCSFLGMDVKKVTDSENTGRDLIERLEIAKGAGDYDFIHVHSKAPDEAAHAKDPELKKSVIETLDKAMIFAKKKLVSNEDILLVVTADHSTASAGRMIHSGETVPLTMVGKYARRDDVTEFNETSCASGGLGQVRGKELMYLILNMLDRGKLFGLMDSPVDQPYFPGDFRPLKIKNG